MGYWVVLWWRGVGSWLVGVGYLFWSESGETDGIGSEFGFLLFKIFATDKCRWAWVLVVLVVVVLVVDLPVALPFLPQ